jgi:hypothetical protein
MIGLSVNLFWSKNTRRTTPVGVERVKQRKE